MGTRQALIETALAEFGLRGFDGIGTRELADKAGTTMSAITYHFGSKQGLYRACAEYVAERISEVFAEVPSLEQAPDTANDALQTCRDLLAMMARTMTSPHSETWSSFIAREQQNPTEAFEILSSHMFDPMIGKFFACIALCRPELGEREVKALAAVLLGLPLNLRHSKAGIARLFDAARIEDDLRDLLIAQIDDIVVRSLSGSSAQNP